MTIGRMQEPRQLYGLGGFLKKIGKGIKSFVKSPFGKAALIGLGGWGLAGGGPFSGLAGLLGKSAMQSGPLNTSGSGIMGMFGKAKDAFTNMSTAGKWGVGGIATWLLGQGMSGDEVQATVRDPNKLKPYLSMYYKNVNQDATDEEVNEFVETNTSEYAADGGRIGLYAGGNGEGIESIDIEEKLQVGAPEITYTGNRMPPEENVASTDLYGNESDADEHSMRLFGKPFKVLSPDELEEFWNEMERLKNKFISSNISEEENMRVASHEGNDAWLENRVQQLMDEGMDWGAAAAQAQREMKEGDVPEPFLATGGRVGFEYGSSFQKNYLINKGYGDQLANMSPKEISQFYDSVKGTWTQKAEGGRIGLKEGMPTGIMRSNQAGVTERDYRDTGGFVPVGIKERADDVPAMLSKNEFVMTADAVRGAGGGNMDKGAQLMYNNMKNLEKRVV